MSEYSGEERRSHPCFLSSEEKQLLKDILKVAQTMKGSAIKGFAFGLFLVFLLGSVGAIWGIKTVFDFLRQ